MIPGVDNDSIVYLNGQYVRLGDAKISVLDRGFIFGDGIYEVVPAYNGKPFRIQGHLVRLERSLSAVGIVSPFSREGWEDLVNDVLARNTPKVDSRTAKSGATAADGQHLMVYLQVTRGVAKRDHTFPQGVQPTVFAMASPFTRPSAQQREQGLSVVPITDQRWLHCDIKSVSLLGNVLARQHAVQAGVDEVVQFRDGYMTEGALSNIWVVKNGTLLAPPKNNLILEGIRYGLLQELAQTCGINFQARPIVQSEVEQADELLLTGATKEVLPITRYDGKPVGSSGTPGPVYAALRAAYDKELANLIAA